MHDVSKIDKTRDKSGYGKSEKNRHSKHERHRRYEDKKLKHRRSRSRSLDPRRDNERHHDIDRSGRHRKYSEKHYHKHHQYVDKCKINNSDFNALSEHKHKSRNRGDESHKRLRSTSVESNPNDGLLSPESDDKELLEHLRLRRSHLLAELSNQENETRERSPVSASISVCTPHEINIIFDAAANCVDRETKEEKEKNDLEKSIENGNGDCLDMFADNFDLNANPERVGAGIVENPRLNDNWDDAEGYYSVRLGEVIDGRYTVFNLTGKGVFSNVVKARDSDNNNEEVAIKLIRNNDMMYRSGLRELDFLRKINEMDKNDKYHCVRLLCSFLHKNHLCLVFECLDMNLRDVLKKYGRNVGLNINAIRSYAQQLLLSLKLIRRAELIHADIKPDNILVNDTKTVLKLSDFGSAITIENNDNTEYMVSRFYRAPEIMLGLEYDYNIDLWAIAVTLYELYTGQIMFPGKDNNDMLRLMMNAKGRFPNKMIKKAAFRDKYFDEQYNFLQKEVDKITEMEKIKVVNPGQPRTLSYNHFLRSKHVEDDDHKIRQFRDFIDRMLQLDPTKRIPINDALNHPFITESTRK